MTQLDRPGASDPLSVPFTPGMRDMSSRGDHLEWMHLHFAAKVIAGSQLLGEVEAEDGGA